MSKFSFVDGERIRKAHSVRTIPPIFERLAVALAGIPELRYVKIFPERVSGSNSLSADGKQYPVVKIGEPGLVGVELLIDAKYAIVQFYALTSSTRGCGRRIVDAVVGATPDDWFLAVAMDWSGGFWARMAQEYPRLKVC
jgi:hypothetical protein